MYRLSAVVGSAVCLVTTFLPYLAVLGCFHLVLACVCAAVIVHEQTVDVASEASQRLMRLRVLILDSQV